jgi:peptidoglycan/xylan/chitin deacetylase (PgdA/CDA1 family)
MRPPYGAHNSQVRRVCDEMGYRVILWDVDTNDWRGRSAAQIVRTILNEARDGSIILMHDRRHKVDGKMTDTVVPATEQVIDGLRAKGFEFVTVSQLLAQPRLGKSASQAPAAPLSKGNSHSTSTVDTPQPSGQALLPGIESPKP